ncbi:hypothetical protein HYQ46_003151 [Verticillium longisporum]|nr:hypothetical protein HYQ46_003151 [Verticillium longisporum]
MALVRRNNDGQIVNIAVRWRGHPNTVGLTLCPVACEGHVVVFRQPALWQVDPKLVKHVPSILAAHPRRPYPSHVFCRSLSSGDGARSAGSGAARCRMREDTRPLRGVLLGGRGIVDAVDAVSQLSMAAGVLMP